MGRIVANFWAACLLLAALLSCTPEGERYLCNYRVAEISTTDSTVLAGFAARDGLSDTLEALGFPYELGDVIARYLGSPKAILRMRAYLENEKPKKTETVVDEMLAIRAEIDAWRERKSAQEANAQYNALLWYGLELEDE